MHVPVLKRHQASLQIGRLAYLTLFLLLLRTLPTSKWHSTVILQLVETVTAVYFVTSFIVAQYFCSPISLSSSTILKRSSRDPQIVLTVPNWVQCCISFYFIIYTYEYLQMQMNSFKYIGTTHQIPTDPQHDHVFCRLAAKNVVSSAIQAALITFQNI